MYSARMPSVLVLLAVIAVSFQADAFTAFPQSVGIAKAPSIGTASRTMTAVGVGAEVADGLVQAWDSYNVALNENPLVVKSVTAGVILGAADLTGQAIQANIDAKDGSMDGNSSGVDLARAARFAFFGLVLQAPWNHFYYIMLDGALPPTPEPFTPTTGIKVFIDQFIQAPIFTVLIFAFLGTLEGKSLDDVKQQLDEDYKDTMLANWKLWVPATAVNIAFCPPMLRVLFLNVVFFGWSIFLSLKLNKNDTVES